MQIQENIEKKIKELIPSVKKLDFVVEKKSEK